MRIPALLILLVACGPPPQAATAAHKLRAIDSMTAAVPTGVVAREYVGEDVESLVEALNRRPDAAFSMSSLEGDANVPVVGRDVDALGYAITYMRQLAGDGF